MSHHTVYLGLGSNLGDRAGNIQRALAQLRAYAPVQATSFLYETPAAYVLDQPPFLNAVCRVSTDLSPHDLIRALKATEQELGRCSTARYGPRQIDLDILFYDSIVIESEELTVPHPALPERAFVLQPLMDLAPSHLHPTLGQPIEELWRRLAHPGFPKVLCMGRHLWRWGSQSYIMGIVNATPDSFSGDGLWRPIKDRGEVVEWAVAQGRRFVAEGAHCIDVGGMSTRPGHVLIPIEEELARVVPVVEALAAAVDVPISIDTFRSDVAEAALQAGASMVNDIWGLRFDPDVAAAAARAWAPLVVMHNHAWPEDPEYRVQFGKHAFRNIRGELLGEILFELLGSVSIAESMGLPRWSLILDPGIGFGKTLDQHLTLIRRLSELRTPGYPLLVGASRKSFIGKVLGLPVEERLEGTVAVNVLAIDRGADIVRVHDVRAVARAAQMVDAIVRRQ